MNTNTRPEATTDRAVKTGTGVFTHPEMDYESPTAKGTRYAAALLRISLGWVFLWAFIDKTFALGFGTGRNPETGVVDYLGDAAWLNGGSPTEGFLSHGTKGPFADFFQSFAGAGWADFGFMLGLLGIGTALILGIGIRIAAVSGATMLLLMWAASAIWPDNNPLVDDHIVYAIALGLLAFLSAGRTWGLGKVWERIPFVARHGWLK